MRATKHILLWMLAAIPAWGKIVTIEWQRDPTAAQYELEVKQGGTIVLDKRFAASESEWKGNLPSGSYVYRIRSFNAKGKAGMWSDLTPFLVQAPPPPPPPPTPVPSPSPSPTPAPKPVEKPKAKPQPSVAVAPAPTRKETPPTASTSLSAGLLGGSGYFFLAVEGQTEIFSHSSLGLRVVHSSTESATGTTTSVTGTTLDFKYFLGEKNLVGPFLDLGLGAYFFSAANTLGSESFRPGLAGQAGVGWVFGSLQGGLNLTLLVGIHYLGKPDISVLTFNTVGTKALGAVLLGYSF